MSHRPESNDNCSRCGRPLCYHDKTRVTHDNGRWSYNYICPTTQGLGLLDQVGGSA